MGMQDYTTDCGFLPHLDCGSVDEAVRALVTELESAGHVVDPEGLVEEIMRREAEGSTAIGDGLVIPHARYRGIDQVRLAVATLARPLDIPAEDDRPVDVVILLVGPVADPRRMLQVLARLARQVRRPPFLDRLRGAASVGELRDIFTSI